MAIKLLFTILTTVQYRALGSLIDLAADDPRFSVNLLFLSRSASDSSKAYQTPVAENLPERLRGRIAHFTAGSEATVQTYLNNCELIVSTVGPAYLERTLKDIFGSGFADLVRQTPTAAVFDTHHSIYPIHDFFGATLSFWPSKTYFDLAASSYPQEKDAYRARAFFVGYPKGDHLFLPDNALRAKKSRKVLYIPDSIRLKNEALFLSPWHSHIWCKGSHIQRIAALLSGRLGLGNAHYLWKHCSISHAGMISALKSFCEANKARLVMAPRRPKDCGGGDALTAEEASAADELLTDRHEYPQSLLMTMKDADLVISGYRSESLLDGLAAGVPYITLSTPAAGLSPWLQEHAASFDSSRSHFPGATWNIPVEDFIAMAPSLTLEHFKIDADALAARRTEFVGPVDGKVAGRILDIIAEKLSR